MINLTESLRHLKAKDVLQKILLEHDFSIVSDEYALDTILTPLGERDYILDILAERDGKLYAFEIDGFKGHSTKTDFYKMRIRDQALLDKGIRTVRLSLNDIVGKKKQPIEILLMEIKYQLI